MCVCVCVCECLVLGVGGVTANLARPPPAFGPCPHHPSAPLSLDPVPDSHTRSPRFHPSSPKPSPRVSARRGGLTHPGAATQLPSRLPLHHLSYLGPGLRSGLHGVRCNEGGAGHSPGTSARDLRKTELSGRGRPTPLSAGKRVIQPQARASPCSSPATD